MPNEVEKLLEEVEEIAIEHHGEIIRQAVENASIACPFCNFPVNVDIWNHIFPGYVEARLREHRAKRRYNRLDSICGDMDTSKDDLEKAYKNVITTSSIAEVIKNSLEAAYPCNRCKRVFNPTMMKGKPSIPIPSKQEFFE